MMGDADCGATMATIAIYKGTDELSAALETCEMCRKCFDNAEDSVVKVILGILC